MANTENINLVRQSDNDPVSIQPTDENFAKVDAAFGQDRGRLTSLEELFSSGALPVNKGGTGAVSAGGAREALGAAAAGHSHSAADINAGTLPASRGGTGKTSDSEAAKNYLKKALREIELFNLRWSDWNDAKEEGIYYVIDDMGQFLHAPSSAEEHILIVSKPLDNSFILQTAIPISLMISGGSQPASTIIRRSFTSASRGDGSTGWSDWGPDSEWQALPLSSSATAVNYGGSSVPKFKRTGDRVEITGAVKATWNGSGIMPLGTLPEGFRPSSQVAFLAPVSTTGTAAIALMYIASSGSLGVSWIKSLGGENITTERTIYLSTSFSIVN